MGINIKTGKMLKILTLMKMKMSLLSASIR